MLGILVGVTFVAPSFGQGFSVNITVDEFGNSLFTNSNGFHSALPFALLPDPGPGGLASVLTYDLLNPPGLVAGDVRLFDPITDVFSDVVRFNVAPFTPNGDTGILDFYSDPLDGLDSLADSASPPAAFYTNALDLFETKLPNGTIGVIYTPTEGQPGFVAGAAGPVTYEIISDAPEPTTFVLLGCGGVFLLWRRRRHAAA